MEKEQNLKELFRDAPDSQFADSLKWLIEEWDEEPTAIQIFKTLDFSARFGGASTMCLSLFEIWLKQLIEDEQTSYEKLVEIAEASWRKEHQ